MTEKTQDKAVQANLTTDKLKFGIPYFCGFFGVLPFTVPNFTKPKKRAAPQQPKEESMPPPKNKREEKQQAKERQARPSCVGPKSKRAKQ